jgi:DNA mismatch endonuclease (patch repair protein)
MPDFLSPVQRSKLMSRVKNRDTKIEIAIRSILHRSGFRFRRNVKSLPGKPDIVLPKYNATIFVHGCFWHGHSCIKGKLPATRVAFWREKISGNQNNDKDLQTQLLDAGWRVAVIWECAYRNREKGQESTDLLRKWIISNSQYCEIPL